MTSGLFDNEYIIFCDELDKNGEYDNELTKRGKTQ